MQLSEEQQLIVETNKKLEAEGTSLEEVVKLNQEQFGTTEETNDPLNTPELNQAAYIFQSSIPRIKALSKNMSRNGLARVFNAVVEFPLAGSYPRFKGVEQELFNLVLSSMSAKSIMTSAFMQQSGGEIKQEIEQGIVNELLAEQNSEEESNG